MAHELTSGWLEDGHQDEWRNLLQASRQGYVYSLPEYLEALCAATGASFRIVGVRRGDELVGGIAPYQAVQAAHPAAGPRSLLQYHSLVVRDSASRYPSRRTAHEVAVQRKLCSELQSLRFRKITLKNDSSVRDVRAFVEAGWEFVPSYTYVVPLQSLDAAWKQTNRAEPEAAREPLHRSWHDG